MFSLVRIILIFFLPAGEVGCRRYLLTAPPSGIPDSIFTVSLLIRKGTPFRDSRLYFHSFLVNKKGKANQFYSEKWRRKSV